MSKPLVVVLSDQPDSEDLLLREPFVSPAGRLLKTLTAECLPGIDLCFKYASLIDVPACLNDLQPSLVILVGQKDGRLQRQIEMQEVKTLRCEHHPRDFLDPKLDQRTFEERYVSLKNTLLTAYHNLTE